MTVWQNNLKRGWHEDVVTPADYLEWRAQSRSFEAMAAHMGRGFNLRAGQEAERIRGALVSVDFFKVLGTTPRMGRAFQPGDTGGQGGRVVVISHALWQKTFGGDREIVGQAITLGSEPFRVRGVGPPGFVVP